MTGKDKAILILEKKLGKAYRNIAVEDLERLLRAELDKSAEEMDTVLVHSLLDILEPTDSIMGDEAVELAQLSAEIEAEIAARTFMTSGGKPFSFETVCDDVAYLMVEQYEKRAARVRVCFQKHKSKRKLKKYAVRQRKPKGKQAVNVEYNS